MTRGASSLISSIILGVVANHHAGDVDADRARHRARKRDWHHGAVNGDAAAPGGADAGQDAALRPGGPAGRGAGDRSGAAGIPYPAARQLSAAAVLRGAVPDDEFGRGPFPLHDFEYAAAGDDGVLLLLDAR